MTNRLLTTTALIAAILLLSSCGFVTAPLGYGSAYAGKGTIKVADKSVEYGKQAANVVVDTAINVSEAAVEGMKPDPEATVQRGSLRAR